MGRKGEEKGGGGKEEPLLLTALLQLIFLKKKISPFALCDAEKACRTIYPPPPLSPSFPDLLLASPPPLPPLGRPLDRCHTHQARFLRDRRTFGSRERNFLPPFSSFLFAVIFDGSSGGVDVIAMPVL